MGPPAMQIRFFSKLRDIGRSGVPPDGYASHAGQDFFKTERQRDTGRSGVSPDGYASHAGQDFFQNRGTERQRKIRHPA